MIARTLALSFPLLACGPSDWGPPAPAVPVPVFGDTTDVTSMRLRVGDSECAVFGEPAEREHFCDLPRALTQGDRIHFLLELSTSTRSISLEREVSVPVASAWASVWVHFEGDQPELELVRIIEAPPETSLELDWAPSVGNAPSYRVSNRRTSALWPSPAHGMLYGGVLFAATLEDDGRWKIDPARGWWSESGVRQLVPGEDAKLRLSSWGGYTREGWTRFSTWVREEAELERDVFLRTDYLLTDEVYVQGRGVEQRAVPPNPDDFDDVEDH